MKNITNLLLLLTFCSNSFCETNTLNDLVNKLQDDNQFHQQEIMNKQQSEAVKEPEIVTQSETITTKTTMDKNEIELLHILGSLISSNAGLPSLNLSDAQINAIIDGMKSSLRFEPLPTNYRESVDKLGTFLQDLESKAIEKNKLSETEFLSAKDKENGIIKTKSGLRYRVLKPAVTTTDKTKITSDSNVKVSYKGQLLNGFVFDENDDASFYIGSLIAGFQEALQLMSVGETIEAYIPSDLGYKNQSIGSIPPASCLIFTITLKEVINS